MKLLLRSLARDIRDQNDTNIDKDTVADYSDIFKRLFLINNQMAFSTNIRSSAKVKQTEGYEYNSVPYCFIYFFA